VPPVIPPPRVEATGHSAAPPRPQKIAAHVDQVACWFGRAIDPAELDTFEAGCLCRPYVEHRLHRGDPRLRCRVVLSQPSCEALTLLARIAETTPVLVNKLEVACEYGFATLRDAVAFDEFLVGHLVLPRRASRAPIAYGSTFYPDPRRWRQVAWAVYPARRGKMSDGPAVRAELRALGARWVRRLGVRRPTDLVALDPANLVRRWMQLERVDVPALGRKVNRRPKAKKPQATRYCSDVDARTGHAIMRALRPYYAWPTESDGRGEVPLDFPTPAQAVRHFLREMKLSPKGVFRAVDATPYLPPNRTKTVVTMPQRTFPPSAPHPAPRLAHQQQRRQLPRKRLLASIA
jgi:hypothetical protein